MTGRTCHGDPSERDPLPGNPNARSERMSTERLADHLVNYLFDGYQGTRHVRRVATWVGFLLKAIEKLPGANPRPNRSRQVVFDYGGHAFRARYRHDLGSRGGVEFVEMLPGRGRPDAAGSRSASPPWTRPRPFTVTSTRGWTGSSRSAVPRPSPRSWRSRCSRGSASGRRATPRPPALRRQPAQVSGDAVPVVG